MKTVDITSFEQKKTLNTKIWQGFLIKPEITQQIKKIVHDFMSNNNIEQSVLKDIVITGSLANFNWSKYSDFDIHLILCFEDINKDKELVKSSLDAKRIQWNLAHNIKIKGFPVELYFEDCKEPHYSTGIYSINQDKWIKQPQKQETEVDEEQIWKKASHFMNDIDHVATLYEDGMYKNAYDHAESIKNKIKNFRKSGLEEKGEWSIENIVFKALRRNGYIKWLIKLKNQAYDKLMSLDEEQGGGGFYTGSGAGMDTWVDSDPSGWTELKNNLLDEYPKSEISAVFDVKSKTLKIYKISLPKELRKQGYGSEIVDKITDWADNIQATIVLTPSTDFGASSVDRLFRFYKRFGFVSNKGAKKDFSISDTMYRKPQ